MKKFFHKVAIVLVAMTASLSFTSCDSDTLTTILGTVIQYILDPGTSYDYKGTLKSGPLKATGDGFNWINSNETSTFSNVTVRYTAGTNSSATLEIPGFTDGKMAVGDITVKGLAITENSSAKKTTFGIGDNSTIVASVTVDGVKYDENSISSVYISSLDDKVYTSTFVTSENLSTFISIVFANSEGENVYALNIDYSGSIIAQ